MIYFLPLQKFQPGFSSNTRLFAADIRSATEKFLPFYKIWFKPFKNNYFIPLKIYFQITGKSMKKFDKMQFYENIMNIDTTLSID